ncbi:MAG: DNA topology modulation protein FlaR [Candidatus Woesearchaeota archaeon]
MTKKIRILGGPGAGKSYITHMLREKLKIPAYDLDDIFCCKNTQNYDDRAKPEVRDAQLKKILQHKEWIIEGVYGDWTKQTFEQADIILILQPKTSIRQWRILRRFVRRKILFWQDNRTESLKNFLGLFAWSKKYDRDILQKIKDDLIVHKDKMITITKSNINIQDIEKLAKSTST